MTREARTEQAVVLRLSGPGAGALVAAAVFLGLIAAGFGVLAVLTGADGRPGWALGIGALACFIGYLAVYALRDARARLGWRIAVGPDGIDLDLPAARSLAARLPAVRMRLNPGDVAAVETRLEAYRSLGTVTMLRSYALCLRDGRRIVLGEDRALGTALAAPRTGEAAHRLARAAGLGWRDLGMVEGGARPLLLAPVAPLPWDAPSLGPERQAALWRRARMLGRTLWLAVAVVAIAAALSLLA